MFKFKNISELDLYNFVSNLYEMRFYYHLPEDIKNKLLDIEKECWSMIPSECYEEEF